MAGRILPGNYTAEGRPTPPPPHECDKPKITEDDKARLPTGTVWQCDDCGKAWRVVWDTDPRDHDWFVKWTRVPSLDQVYVR